MFQLNYFCVSHFASSLGSLLLSDWHTACGGGNVEHQRVQLLRVHRARVRAYERNARFSRAVGRTRLGLDLPEGRDRPRPVKG